jgi:hypothetical protein
MRSLEMKIKLLGIGIFALLNQKMNLNQVDK